MILMSGACIIHPGNLTRDVFSASKFEWKGKQRNQMHGNEITVSNAYNNTNLKTKLIETMCQ